MPRSSTATGSRRPTNVTLPDTLLREARELGINLAQACERGLAAEVATQRRERWLEQNHDAIRDWNEHVKQHGLPLACQTASNIDPLRRAKLTLCRWPGRVWSWDASCGS